MTSTLKVVCLIAALLAGLGASAAVASPLLTAEEMGAIKGGCTQYYCISHVCGYTMACGGLCEWPEYGPCNPYEQTPEDVVNCASLTGPGNACTRDSLEDCGTWWVCFCYHSLHEDYCLINPSGQHGSQGQYYPCP